MFEKFKENCVLTDHNETELFKDIQFEAHCFF
jgi:hypothetical protein